MKKKKMMMKRKRKRKKTGKAIITKKEIEIYIKLKRQIKKTFHFK